MLPYLRKTLSLLLTAAVLASCAPQPILQDFHSAWEYNNLRLIDEPGTQPAGSDIAAVYLRTERDDFQVRLDFVDLSGEEAYEVELFINARPGGSPLPLGLYAGAFDWDTRIAWGSGSLTALQADGSGSPGLNARVERNLSQDSLVFSLDVAALGLDRRGASVMAVIYDRETNTLLDSAGPARSGDAPPSPAPLLLAFWGTMPASTPSQAARAWNGAHTGPFNNRHGLYHLLRAAEDSQVPVTLLDLKTPEALSALDYAGGGGLIDSTVRQGLAYLPDAIAASAPNLLLAPDRQTLEWSLEASRAAGLDFQLPSMNGLEGIISAPAFPQALLAAGSESTRVLITHDGEPTDSSLISCGRWQQSTVISLPSGTISPTLQMADEDGPAVAFKRDLLAAAQTLTAETGLTDPCRGAIAFLGGDLSRSALGDPAISRTSLAYLASHPWVRRLTPVDFAASSPQMSYQPPAAVEPPHMPVFNVEGTPLQGGRTLPVLQKEVLEQLQALPQGRLSEAARRMVAALLAPVNSGEDTFRLNAGYLGQVGLLLAGASWEARQPERVWSCYDGTTCGGKMDVDWDDEPETILASESYLAVIEPRGGYLAALFARDDAGAHQIVAPSWQLMTGFSDPTTWQLDHGPASEPGAMRGAFSEVPAGFVEPSWEPYAQEGKDSGVVFTSPDRSVVKSYSLLPDGLEVRYQTQGAVTVQVPLAVDPWNRFAYQWRQRYAVEADDTGWTVRAGGFSVRLIAHGASSDQMSTSMRSFMDPLPLLDQPEDPFIDYGPAFFYPFPTALVEARVQGEVVFRIGGVR